MNAIAIMKGTHALRSILLLMTSLVAATGTSSGEDRELPVLQRSLAATETPAPPFTDGRFAPKEEETIVFVGGTDTYDQARHGFLEERIQTAWPELGLKLRNLAWPGDVLTYQARPRYFYTEKGDSHPGSVPDQRKRTEAGIVFVAFGKMESLPGGEWSPEAYLALLEQLRTRTGRLVLVAPTPFFPSGPAGALSEERNEPLAAIVAEIESIAARENALFVDLFNPFRKTPDPALSADGIHLSEGGHRAVAEQFAIQLAFPHQPKAEPSAEVLQSLQQAIARKNRLWQQYYHPTNWAFLFGDRQHVPASRDPVERSERWFLRELDSLPGLIDETESDIHRYARAVATTVR